MGILNLVKDVMGEKPSEEKAIYITRGGASPELASALMDMCSATVYAPKDYDDERRRAQRSTSDQRKVAAWELLLAGDVSNAAICLNETNATYTDLVLGTPKNAKKAIKVLHNSAKYFDAARDEIGLSSVYSLIEVKIMKESRADNILGGSGCP
jgi:hypothetical protein